jgi:hypothetical protein
MSEFQDVRQNARLEALERRVAAILDHLGLPDPVPANPFGVSEQVAELARAGKTMQAVKAYMDETGADMNTARDAVAAVPPPSAS